MEEEKVPVNNQEKTDSQQIRAEKSEKDVEKGPQEDAPIKASAAAGLHVVEKKNMPIWFSVKIAYLIQSPRFKDEQLPIELENAGRKIRIEQEKHKRIVYNEKGEKDETATENGKEYNILSIAITNEVGISEKRFKDFVERLENGKTISLFEGDGRLKNSLQDHLPAIEEELERVYKLVRWRYQINGKKIIYNEEYLWSIDGQNWNRIDSCRPPSMVSIEMVQDIEQSKADIANTIGDLLTTNTQEPLHHTLLREAESILRSNPESAFVIAVVALEIGVKHYIGIKVPASSWLVTNMASPDVHKLFKFYIPTLDEHFKLTEEQLEKVNNIINNRNTMVHTGKIAYDNEGILKCTMLIKDILRKIDFHLGYNW